MLSEGLDSSCNIGAQWIGDKDISDYCPVWLMSSSLNWGPKPLRFNNCWLEHEDFKEFIRHSWNSFKVEGRDYHVLKEKLRLLKQKMRTWSRDIFGLKDLRIENIVKELNEIERVAANGGPINDDQRKLLNEEFWKELNPKESLLAQKNLTKIL